MRLERLRRRDPALDAQMRADMFTEGESLAAAKEAVDDTAAGDTVATEGSLGVGSLRAGGDQSSASRTGADHRGRLGRLGQDRGRGPADAQAHTVQPQAVDFDRPHG